MRLGADSTNISIAAPAELGKGEVAQIRIPREHWDGVGTPALLWARVNESRTSVSSTASNLPEVSSLGPPTPNPARSAVAFALALAQREASAAGSVQVFDVTGRQVRILASGSFGPGLTSLIWDLHDGNGRTVHPGIYLVRAKIGRFETHHRVVVVP
jgi:hypothetical protein